MAGQPLSLGVGEQWNDQLVCPLFWVPAGQPCVNSKAPGSLLGVLCVAACGTSFQTPYFFDLNIEPLLVLFPAFGTVRPWSLMEAPVPQARFFCVSFSLVAVRRRQAQG